MIKPRLCFAVVHVDQQRLEAVAEVSGKRRWVEIRAWSKDPMAFPPADWADQVFKELAFQDSVAHLPAGLK